MVRYSFPNVTIFSNYCYSHSDILVWCPNALMAPANLQQQLVMNSNTLSFSFHTRLLTAVTAQPSARCTRVAVVLVHTKLGYGILSKCANLNI